MDRKNFFLGMACIVGAFALFFLTKPTQPPASATPPAQQVVKAAVAAPKATVALAASGVGGSPVAKAVARHFFIENDFVKVTLSSRGGAVEKIELKKEQANVGKPELVTFNAGNEEAALVLAVKPTTAGALDPIYSEFTAQNATAASITLVGALADGTRLERNYSFTAPKAGESAEAYSLRFSTRVIPPAGKPAVSVWVSTGCWQPTTGDSANQFLSVLAYDGEDLTRVGLDKFTDSSGFFGLGAHKAAVEHSVVSAGKSLAWVASGNQFFAAILHPDAAVRGTRAEVVVLPVAFEGGKRGLHAFTSWETPPAADLSRTLEGDFFVGPKEYARLSALPDSQVSVLQFSKLLGFISFGAICKLLLAILGDHTGC